MGSDSMNKHSVKSGLLCMAATCALASMQAQAVGLGAIEVKSKLDQPFVAEIPLTINSPDEAEGLVVRLASPEAYERVGMDPNVLSANLQFTVGRNARGEPVVRVSTPQRMNDPYVGFLLEADWGKGKMVREYTALLDPPHMVSVPRRVISAPTVASTPLPAPVVTQPVAAAPVLAPTPVATAPAQPTPAPAPAQPAPEPATPIAAAPQPEPPAPIAAAPQPEPQPDPQPAPMPAAPAPEPMPAPAPVAQAPQPPAPLPEPAPAPSEAKATPEAVTVGHGQSLSAIADQLRPADVSVNRMMIALQRANPDAFIGDNINRLKSGAVLRIPASDQAQSVTAAEANALVHDQVESWRQGAQPAPQLQPEETADSKPVAPTSVRDSSATAATEHPAAPKTKTAAATHVSNKAPATAQADATVSTPKTSRPRGAHLEIVPPGGNAAAGIQTGASEGGSGSELRAQLAQTKEELTARNAEVSDLKSKVSDLEKMQNDSTQLLSMKDSQLAAMQQRLAELQKNNAANASASAPATAATTANSGTVTVPASNASTAGTPGVTAPAASLPNSTVSAAPSTAAPQPVEPPTPWYLRPLILIGGGLVALAGLLGLMLRRPREPEPAPRSRFDASALAASMAAARAESQPAANPRADDAPAAAKDSPKPVAMAEPVPASQPVWTDEHVATPLPTTVAASSPAPVADEPATPIAAHDDWVIPSEVTLAPPEPAPALPASNPTSMRPAMPGIGDANPSVATKLELAHAYMDIGDHDGARSMLEEVLIEGNAGQQEQAFAMLDQLEG